MTAGSMIGPASAGMIRAIPVAWNGVTHELSDYHKTCRRNQPVFDLSAIQAAMLEQRVDGWLLYDFRGLNILARRREPSKPINITTPDALRLRHEPDADCARYDRLRSALL